MLISPTTSSTTSRPVTVPETSHSLKSFGHVEVLRIKRRSRKQPDLLLFKGSPGSKHSTARSVLVTVMERGGEIPTPYFDSGTGRIHLAYPDVLDPELQALLADPGSFMCYFWTSFDGAHSHAWLLSTR